MKIIVVQIVGALILLTSGILFLYPKINGIMDVVYVVGIIVGVIALLWGV